MIWRSPSSPCSRPYAAEAVASRQPLRRDPHITSWRRTRCDHNDANQEGGRRHADRGGFRQCDQNHEDAKEDEDQREAGNSFPCQSTQIVLGWHAVAELLPNLARVGPPGAAVEQATAPRQTSILSCPLRLSRIAAYSASDEQSLQRHQRSIGHRRSLQREARPRGQPAALAGDLPGPDSADRASGRGRRARARHGALGHARPAAVRRPAGTNIRNAKSPHWRGWLGRRNRCIVPATSFCEYLDTKPRKTSIWFALGEDRPLFAFAGLWTPWRGAQGPKSAPVEGEHELFGFLTTEANAVVAPVHEKAMPVILTTPAEVDRWLEAEISDALALQRPLSDDALRIVAKGERTDGSPAVGAALRRKHPVRAFEFRKPLTITGRRSGEIRPCSLAKVQNRLSHPGMFGTRGILRRGP